MGPHAAATGLRERGTNNASLKRSIRSRRSARLRDISISCRCATAPSTRAVLLGHVSRASEGSRNRAPRAINILSTMNSLRDVACARHCGASSVLRYGARLALTGCGQGCWRSLSYPALGAPAPHPGYGESCFEERRRVASNGERHGQEGLGEVGPEKASRRHRRLSDAASRDARLAHRHEGKEKRSCMGWGAI